MVNDCEKGRESEVVTQMTQLEKKVEVIYNAVISLGGGSGSRGTAPVETAGMAWASGIEAGIPGSAGTQVAGSAGTHYEQ